MSNVRIITPNDADDATLTASPAAVTTLPVTNLQDQTRARVWRSTSLATQTISGDFASSYSLSSFALVRHNLSPTATFRFRIYTGLAQTGTTLYDSGTVTLGTSTPWGLFLWGVGLWGGGSIFSGWTYSWNALYFSTVVGARSFSLVITDPDNGDGYMQASRLVIGTYFSPDYNIEHNDLSLEWAESSRQQRTDGGTLRTDNFDPYRKLTFTLRHITDLEHSQLLEINRVVGLRKDVFLDVYPDETGSKKRDYSGQFKLTQPVRFTPVRWENESQAYEATFAFEES